MKRTFKHPNGQTQLIDTDLNEIWVHPRAKKADFKWSPVKKGLFSVKVGWHHVELDDEPVPGSFKAVTVDFSCPALEKHAALDLRHPDRSVEYNRGWADAIAHCYVFGANIEMADRVSKEARRLGLI